MPAPDVPIAHCPTYDWADRANIPVRRPYDSAVALALEIATLEPGALEHDGLCLAVRDRIMALSRVLLLINKGLPSAEIGNLPRYDNTPRVDVRLDIPLRYGVLSSNHMKLDGLDDYALAKRVADLQRDDPEHHVVCMAAFDRLFFLNIAINLAREK